LVKQFLAELHVADEEELGVVLEEGESIVHRADEDVLFEDGSHASVGGGRAGEAREGERERGRK